MDDQTKQIIQDLKDENRKYNEKNMTLKNQATILQNKINSITSEFEQFRQTISRNLKSKIRPSVVSMESDYNGLKDKYDDLESKYRQVIIIQSLFHVFSYHFSGGDIDLTLYIFYKNII